MPKDCDPFRKEVEWSMSNGKRIRFEWFFLHPDAAGPDCVSDLVNAGGNFAHRHPVYLPGHLLLETIPNMRF